MKKTAMRNFHVPLPDDLYKKLQEEAVRSRQPMTVLARQAIESWVQQRQKAALHETLAAYAAQCAETPADLDEELEAASVEYLLTERETTE